MRLGLVELDRVPACAEIDQDALELRGRLLDGIPFVLTWLGATYLKARENGRVVSETVVVAIAARGCDHREMAEVDVGDSGNETSRDEFLRGPTGRGLSAVQLVIWNAQRALTNVIGRVLQGSASQRCRSTRCATAHRRRAGAPAAHHGTGPHRARQALSRPRTCPA